MGIPLFFKISNTVKFTKVARYENETDRIVNVWIYYTYLFKSALPVSNRCENKTMQINWNFKY